MCHQSTSSARRARRHWPMTPSRASQNLKFNLPLTSVSSAGVLLRFMLRIAVLQCFFCLQNVVIRCLRQCRTLRNRRRGKQLAVCRHGPRGARVGARCLQILIHENAYKKTMSHYYLAYRADLYLGRVPAHSVWRSQYTATLNNSCTHASFHSWSACSQ